jgi:hypothetical protein
MKSVELEADDWEQRIWPSLLRTHGMSIAIRDVCKRKLGFTVRRHRREVKDEVDIFWTDEQTFVHLDFYDEQKKVMFMLKWCGE